MSKLIVPLNGRHSDQTPPNRYTITDVSWVPIWLKRHSALSRLAVRLWLLPRNTSLASMIAVAARETSLIAGAPKTIGRK